MNQYKKDFPIFNHYPNLVYLDNAATTQKPQCLIEAEKDYYIQYNSNIHRSVHHLADKATELYELTRKKVANLIHAKQKEIVFTTGTTHSLNLIAFNLEEHIQKDDLIVLSIVEHHANILPWQRIAQKKGASLFYIKDDELINNPELLKSKVDINRVKIITLTEASNVTGEELPIKKWIDFANQEKIISVIDGAQGVTHKKIDIKDLNCDFYAFSAHKIYGPTGVGVLYGKHHLLNQFSPLLLGGGIIEFVEEQNYTLLDTPHRLEAGTPNIAGIVSLSSVLNYLDSINFYIDNIALEQKKLNQILINELSNINEVKIVKVFNSLPTFNIVSFNIDNIHSHDAGSFLANKNIATRVGQHCAAPLFNHIHQNSSIRASLALYNEREDIDFLIKEIKNCIQFFK
jgi:cysteine desulfurase / selenocysteine lyase